jgi:hypothetical protein
VSRDVGVQLGAVGRGEWQALGHDCWRARGLGGHNEAAHNKQRRRQERDDGAPAFDEVFMQSYGIE